MYDFVLKFIILGNENIGKTTLIKSTFHQNDTQETIAVDFFSFPITIENFNIKIQCWDTSGNPLYFNIIQSYFQEMVGIVLAFDLNDKKSFDDVLSWYNSFQKNNYYNVILIGLKSDLKHEVSRNEILKLKEKLKCDYLEVSSFQMKNVINVWKTLAFNILKDYQLGFFSKTPGFKVKQKIQNYSNTFCNCNII